MGLTAEPPVEELPAETLDEPPIPDVDEAPPADELEVAELSSWSAPQATPTGSTNIHTTRICPEPSVRHPIGGRLAEDRLRRHDAHMHGVQTIDAHYAGQEGFAAVYMIEDRGEVAFVETNTSHAVPRMLAALEAAGRAPGDVKFVIITHVHLDHAGGASALMKACPNATLLAHPKAAKNIVEPGRLVESAKQVYGEEQYNKLYGVIEPIAAERVRAVDDEEVFELGGRELHFFETRGHANHHVSIHDRAANGIFTGDTFGICYPHQQDNGLFVFPTTTPTDFDPQAALESLERIASMGAERVFLTHFGERTDIAPMASQLRPQIERYGRVVEEADASGREGEELDRFCAAQILAEFRSAYQAHGLEGDPSEDPLAKLDVELNGQGVAFAVKKRRYKRAKTAQGS